MVEVLSQTKQSAKKVHTCDHCCTSIGIGEQYERFFIKDGGDTWTWKSHPDCAALASRMSRDQDLCWDEGITLHEEWANEREDMRSYRDEFPTTIGRFEARDATP